MVGAILVGISLAVVVGLTGRALSSQRRGEELATAAALADETLQLVLARGPDDYAKRFPIEGTCESPFSDYRYRLTISAGGSSSGIAGSGSAPFAVTATITWGGSAGTGAQSIVIQTLMATRNGGDDAVGGEPDPKRTPDAAVGRNQ